LVFEKIWMSGGRMIPDCGYSSPKLLLGVYMAQRLRI